MTIEAESVGQEPEIVESAMFERTRSQMGTAFIRLLGYFIEDGAKAVATIEQALRERSAARIVLPAHTLKAEALQFGAKPLGELAEAIEVGARRCVEIQEAPDDLLVPVARLRPLWQATLEVFERETNPLQTRRGGIRGTAANQDFGRL